MDVETGTENQLEQVRQICLAHSAQGRADQTRRATGQQYDSEIAAAFLRDRLADARGRLEGAASGDRMIAHEHADRADRGVRLFRRDHDSSGYFGERAMQRRDRGVRHRMCRLSEGENPNAVTTFQWNGRHRVCGQRLDVGAGYRGAVEVDEQLARATHGHGGPAPPLTV